MTDQQFQPGQTNPPTQNGGVFGGNAEEVIHDPSMFGPLEKIEEEITTDNIKPEVTTSPFDGYVIPQNESAQTKEETIEPIEEKTEETPQEMSFEIEFPSKTNEDLTKEEIPVIKETPSVEETPVEVVEEVPAKIIEEKPVEIVAKIPAEVIEEKENIDDQPKSDIQNKFTNLLDNILELNDILRIKDGEILEIIGANSDKTNIIYQFGLNNQNEIHVKRIETDKEDDEKSFNEIKLGLNPESNLFEIFLDDVLLFEESDLLEDNKKKSQVMEKINKFIFLTESKLKDAQKELRAKQEEEEERKRLQDIFRNF